MIGSLSAILDEFQRIADKIEAQHPLEAAELKIATEMLRRAFIPGAAPAETPPVKPAENGGVGPVLTTSAQPIAKDAKPQPPGKIKTP